MAIYREVVGRVLDAWGRLVSCWVGRFSLALLAFIALGFVGLLTDSTATMAAPLFVLGFGVVCLLAGWSMSPKRRLDSSQNASVLYRSDGGMLMRADLGFAYGTALVVLGAIGMVSRLLG